MSGTVDDIVDITISRQTQSVEKANFGVIAVIAQFPASKTTTAFVRNRYYGSLTEMVTDGWATTDAVYKAVEAIFQQNPRIERVMVGRKDSTDATWTAALAAIKIAENQWYAFLLVDEQTVKVVFSADFVASNSIVFTINGVAVSAVAFSTDQATTMGLLETEIETDISGSAVTIDPADTSNRTLLISLPNTGIQSCSVAITGGASQPTADIDFRGIPTETAVKAAAAWAETEMKIFFMFTTDADVITAADDDIGSFMEAQNYDRTAVFYYDPDEVNSSDPEMGDYINAAAPGKALPYDPGSQTWMFKTLAGVAAYGLTSSESGYALGKNVNTYTRVGGVDIIQEGRVASGEYLDIIRGIDWLTSELQSTIFAKLAQVQKIPFTDEGIAIIEGLIRGVLATAAAQGILVGSTIVVTVPKVADVSSADKAARLLPDVTFTADLQGAIHHVEIAGTVSV